MAGAQIVFHKKNVLVVPERFFWCGINVVLEIVPDALCDLVGVACLVIIFI